MVISFLENVHRVIFICVNPFRPDPGRKMKTNLNFYFYLSLWCFKMFYEGLQDLHKTFEAPQRSENKDLS